MSELIDPQTPATTDPIEGTPAAGGPAPVTLADDALLPLKVGGEDKLVPWKEARSGFMMHSDYTRKTQELAERQRAWEAQQTEFQSRQQEYEQRLSALSGVLQDPNKLAQLYMLANAKTQQPTGPQPLTTEALPHLQQSLEQRLSKQFEQFQHSILQQQEATRIEQDLDQSLKGTLAKHPLLASIPGIEDAIYGRVAALRPKSIDEAKEHARLMVENMALKVKETQEQETKREALAKAQAINGIEPRGGAPVLPQMPQVNKLSDMDDAFIKYLQGQ